MRPTAFEANLAALGCRSIASRSACGRLDMEHAAFGRVYADGLISCAGLFVAGIDIRTDVRVRPLNTKIRAFIEGWNDRAHPFV